MAKCELLIVFDRENRTYQPGETVSGTVVVLAREAVQCDGLTLTARWQTHGAGNQDKGADQTWTLYRGQWNANQTYEYPFSFTAPPGPPTYHGHYLNVDQYVNVRADVPWSFDPKASEEYVLLPGPPDYPGQPTPKTLQQAAGCGPAVTAVVGVVMIVIGAIFFCPMGLLIPVGLILIVWSMRRVVAEWKTGQVQVEFGPLDVSPGGSVPVRLAFTPRGNLAVNGIRATLRAREECVRGSGTDKKTSRHVVHESTTLLADEIALPGGQLAQFQANVVLPPLACYSFSATDNKLIWEIEVVVDIPSWPDWKEPRVLCVRPGGALPAPPLPPAEGTGEPQPTAEPLSRAEEPAEIAPAWPPQRETEEPAERFEPLAEAVAPAEPAAEFPSLVAVFDALAATGRYSTQRETIVSRAAAQSYKCDVAVERVERTYAFDVDDALKDGRTVIGALSGTTYKLSVQTAAAHNAVMDSLQPGQVLQTRVIPVKWNIVHERLEAREAV